ncbi:MAG: hypothetical protein M0R80_25795 [Proteobacteria bacterium]|jgi:hypothetical protein|nr:hypothetical protein [Pseudomonadota bacterium]
MIPAKLMPFVQIQDVIDRFCEVTEWQHIDAGVDWSKGQAFEVQHSESGMQGDENYIVLVDYPEDWIDEVSLDTSYLSQAATHHEHNGHDVIVLHFQDIVLWLMKQGELETRDSWFYMDC